MARWANSSTASPDPAGEAAVPSPRGGHRQRLQPEHVLAGHVERLPAGSEHGDGRGLPEDCLRQQRAGVDQVLAGVEDQQQPRVRKWSSTVASCVRSSCSVQAKAVRDGVGQQRGIAQPGQLDQPDAVGVAVRGTGGGAQRDAGLADPAGADHGDEPRAVKQRGQPRELALAADETGDLRGQLTPAGAGRQRVAPAW